MKYSIVQLREFERAAFAAGDSEKAEIIGDLIQTFEALEILTEAGDDFIRYMRAECDGVAVIDIEAIQFNEFVAAVAEADELI
jgi:hypothetical protein